MNEPIIDSSGNVFLDLGFEPGEAAVLEMRAKFIADLREQIEVKGLSQHDIVVELGLSPGLATEILHDKWDNLNLEMLVSLKARINRQAALPLAA
jgi:predicted XRE-type DNA-binding protein